jgi:hypothetical protein
VSGRKRVQKKLQTHEEEEEREREEKKKKKKKKKKKEKKNSTKQSVSNEPAVGACVAWGAR